MKKGFGTILLGVYVLSAVIFYENMPLQYRTEGLLECDGTGFRMTAADLGVIQE